MLNFFLYYFKMSVYLKFNIVLRFSNNCWPAFMVNNFFWIYYQIYAKNRNCVVPDYNMHLSAINIVAGHKSLILLFYYWSGICECHLHNRQCQICRGFNPLWCLSTPKFSLIPTILVKNSQKYIADPFWFYHKSSTDNRRCRYVTVLK